MLALAALIFFTIEGASEIGSVPLAVGWNSSLEEFSGFEHGGE